MFVRTQYNRVLLPVFLVLLFASSLLINGCTTICSWFCQPGREGITLLDGKGAQIDSIGVFDNLRVRITDLQPGRRYTLRVVDNKREVLAYSRLIAGHDGIIPIVTLLFGENLFSCTSSALQVTGMEGEGHGSIAGTVSDKATNEPLPGANVLVESTPLGAACNVEGQYRIQNVPVGSYTVRCAVIGYGGVCMVNVPVFINSTTEVNFALNVEPIVGEETYINYTYDMEQQALRRIADWEQSLSERSYYMEVLDRRRIIRRVPFTISDDGDPVICAADSNGCPRSGFLQQEDDVYVIGRNFPPGSRVRIFAVEDQRIWKIGAPFTDVTGTDGTPDVAVVSLAADQRDFFVPLWSKGSSTTGLYDIIARYSSSAQSEITSEDVIAADNDVGFLIQTDASDPHIEQNMTAPNSIDVLWNCFQDKFFNNEDVWVAVNPLDRPGGESSTAQNARIYVVAHLDENQWIHGATLNDVSEGYEEVSIKGTCRNQNEVRVWQAPLTNGHYDVVVDFPPFGVYDQGQDIVDELDNIGFQVVDPAAFAIVYPVNDLTIFPGKEVPAGSQKNYLYAVAKIDPANQGTSIYWDSIDIDDPSSDAAPVDPNGNSGDDNRGNHGAAPGAPDGDDGFLAGENASGVSTTMTYHNGIAVVIFYVTMQPGDNFILRGSTSSRFTSYDESAAITVWRKLHAEIDDMGPPSGNTETGNINGVNFNAGSNTSQVTVDVALDDGRAGSTGGRFENGVLTAGGTGYTVLSNTSSIVTVQGQPPNNVPFTLIDDDVMPADVPAPDVMDLARAFEPAFILPVYDTGQNTSNVTFDLNTQLWEGVTQVYQGKGTQLSTADYWIVTVQGGFQTSEETANSGDNDPDDEGTWRGAAWFNAGVIVFEESIRDWIQAPTAAGGGNGVDPAAVCALDPTTPRRPRRQEIVVHEVGHMLYLEHADGDAVAGVDPCGGVMHFTTQPRESSNFTQNSLHELRSITKPRH